MKRKILKLIVFCMIAGLTAGIIPPAADAQGVAAQGPRLLIKIRNIDQLLNDVARLMPPDQDSTVAHQVTMFRGMLQGTDWIDPKRSIVVGMVSVGTETNWIALIPFRTANINFKTAYGAIADDDYYLTAFPPQPGFTVSPGVKKSLLEASVATAESSVVVEAAASDLLAMARPKIAAALESRAAAPGARSGPATMSPEETQAMINNMLQTFEQMEILRLGLDLSGSIFTLQFDVDALPDTFLAGLLIDRGDDTRLADYQVDMPLKFRSRAYNMPGMMQLVGAGFGQIYHQMGIDFNDLAEMTKSFTGEMVGGMQAGPDGMAYEMIYALQPGTDGEGFIKNTYLPWFERYNRQMAAFVARQSGQPQSALYERSTDSIVGGVRVVGVKTNYNAMMPPGEHDLGAMAGGNQVFETRLAAVGDLMFITSDDVVMESLITRARGFATAPAQGPMARFDFNLGSFMAGMQAMAPSTDSAVTWPMDLGRLTMQAEMRDGKLATRTRFNVEDLVKMKATFSTLTAQQAGAVDGAEAGASSTAPPTPAAVENRKLEAHPDYWYEQGGLQSAYGAYKAAAHSYRQAIERSPRFADAHFQLGVAYGEMHQFEAAIRAMTRAIDLDTYESAYYYGRGRVYLLAGEAEQAMRDFMEAGFLGHPDARTYLKDAGVSLE